MKITDLKTYTVVGATPSTPPPKPQDSGNFIDKVGGFLGVENLGKGLASTLKGVTDSGLDESLKGNMEMQNKVTDQIHQDKLMGKDSSRLVNALNNDQKTNRSAIDQRTNIETGGGLTNREVIGSAVNTAALIGGPAQATSVPLKILEGAGTGYGLDVGTKLQDKGKTVGQALTPGIGTAIGAGIPVAGAVLKPAVSIVSRLFKGLGSGLSGVSTKTIDSIVNNPKVALEASKRLATTGNSKVLENNAREIVNGISTIRQEARKEFGKGVEQLAETDIKPEVFRNKTQDFLQKYGISKSGGIRSLSGVEFTDPKNIEKASKLIDRLNNVPLDGKSIRKLADDIENSAFKTATSDERLSFNAFVKDLSSTLNNAISASTDKFGEINSKFSQDMQLTEAVQNTFGKVNFKNLPEVVKASQKLENLFSQKGIAPEVFDSFLKRLGKNPEDFRTGEAVRQISAKESGSNAKGLSMGEMLQQTTSAIVTPQMVKNLSIATGMAKEKLIPFLKQMNPSARNILIQALLKIGSGN